MIRIGDKVDITIKLFPGKDLFLKPMSYGARDTLYGLIRWGCTKLQLFANSPNNLLNDLTKKYSQIRYEEAEQTFNTEQYVKLITGIPGDKRNNGLKVKSPEEVIDAISLSLLYGDWIHDNPIQRRNRIGDISQHQELYNWIVNNFLYGDFPNIELGKIVDMGRISNISTIKKEAQQIVDPDKHSVSYLYAIIRGVHSRDEAIQRQVAAIHSQGSARLGQLMELAMSADDLPVYKSTGSLEQWELDRHFIEVMRNLDSESDK